jgi:hypothetical protein
MSTATTSARSPNATGLADMASGELDDIFGAAPAGDMPIGKGFGTALVAPGTRFGRAMAAVARLLYWQGKEFDPSTSTLRNLITPFGVRAISASVYEDRSWHDGRPCIVLDYSKTSKVARWVRDEIREVEPGVYLGLVYWGRRRLPVPFTLVFGDRRGT